MSEEVQRIRQVVFLVENKIYKFDVNSQTTLKNLRKIIIAAANISNKVFKFFSNNSEIVAPDSTTLDQLFRQEEEIEINVSSIKQKSSDLSPICLKQGLSCADHMFKFPYLYCYDCSKSICSMCVKSETHQNHSLIDKHDYLQNSEVLVSSIFKDMINILNNLSTDKRNEIKSIKSKISNILFPNLIEQIKSVEVKLTELINSFLEQLEKNKEILYANADLLKNLCSDGLEELKYQLKIQDIMIDENIFIIIDEKIKQIANEKNKILNDQKKYEDLVNGSNLIIEGTEDLCNQIISLIDKKLKIFIDNDFKQKILSNVVPNVSKEEIYQLLFSDIKKLAKSPSKLNLTAFSCDKFGSMSSDKKKGLSEINLNLNLLPTFDLTNNGLKSTEDNTINNRNILDHVFDLSQNRIKDIENYKSRLYEMDSKNVVNTGDNVQKESDFKELEGNLERSTEEQGYFIEESKALRFSGPQNEFENEDKLNEEPNIPQEDLNVEMGQDENFNKEITPLKVKEKEIISHKNKRNFDVNFNEKILKEIQKGREEGNVLEKAEKENLIINLIPNSDQLYVFQEKSTNQIFKKSVVFPKILNTDVFPLHSSFSNLNNKIYSSGGLIDNAECKLFFVYDFNNDHVLRLSDMNIPRSFHTSILFDNCLYVVGGNQNKSIERYNMTEMMWSRLGDMTEERKNPIIVNHHDYLYIMFGVDVNGNYIKTVERINLKIPYSKTEIVEFKNEEKLNLGLIGCGIIRHRPDEILLLGGEYENKTKSKSGIFFNFEDHSFKKAEIELEDGLYFQDNTLQEIGKDRFGNFNYDNHFFQIDI
jgi:hypothetical protein